MSDLSLRQVGLDLWRLQGWDLVKGPTDLQSSDDLEASLALSLFTDRRAEEGETDGDQGGWWADSALPVVEGDLWGSRWWLRYRRRLDQETLDLLVSDGFEALEWMKEDRIVDTLEVEAVILAPRVAGVTIRLYRPNTDPVEYRFNRTWDAQAARR